MIRQLSKRFFASESGGTSKSASEWSKKIMETAENINMFAKGSGDKESANITINLPNDWETHKCSAPPTKFTTTTPSLLQIYKDMQMIRRMEMEADRLYKSKLIRGFCHLAIGQEAISVGMEAGCTKDDAIITAYRCHGFTHTRGQSIRAILAELLGKATGVSAGKGGSMHMYAPNFYGGNGIVGAQVPLGTGIALALKYKKKENVCFALYGDGAANQGQIFEAYNIAALRKLPVVYVCENNFYAMGTSIERSSASTQFYTRGDYIPGVRVNGMNVMAVKYACQWAKEYALKNGPIVLEMVTYRYGGHSMSDPGTTYRPREEISSARANKDPIKFLASQLIKSSICTESQLKDIDREAKESVAEASRLAQNDPEPTKAAFMQDIF